MQRDILAGPSVEVIYSTSDAPFAFLAAAPRFGGNA
jgi:hypothetical protein